MFEVTARLKVREGRLDGFKRQAAEVMKAAREKDTKTLRYDWFLSDDGTECEVREGYVDGYGLLEHSDHVWEVRSKLFHDFAFDHDMTVHGDPPQELIDAFESMGSDVAYHLFTLLDGLDGGGEVDPGEVFEATARLRIREGELDGFKRQAAEIMRQTRQQDVQPLRYDWFLSDDGTECEVREAYPDADALLEQQRRLGKAKADLFRFVAGHSMTFYAEPSPALLETMKAMGAGYRQFYVFQGLDTDAAVREGALV